MEGEGHTALQSHAAYFDADGDGLVTLGETYDGLRRLGVGRLMSGLLASIINIFLGPITRGRPSLTISVARIASGVHPFDTGVFDKHGQLDLEHFDALIEQASPPKDRLTRDELRRVIVARGRAERAGFKGWLADKFSAAEAKLLFCLASDSKKAVDGRPEPAITERQLRRFYRGQLLPALARRRRIALARRR